MYKEQQMKSGVRTLASNRMYSRKLKYMSSYSGELRQKRTCRIRANPLPSSRVMVTVQGSEVSAPCTRVGVSLTANMRSLNDQRIF